MLGATPLSAHAVLRGARAARRAARSDRPTKGAQKPKRALAPGHCALAAAIMRPAKQHGAVLSCASIEPQAARAQENCTPPCAAVERPSCEGTSARRRAPLQSAKQPVRKKLGGRQAKHSARPQRAHRCGPLAKALFLAHHKGGLRARPEASAQPRKGLVAENFLRLRHAEAPGAAPPTRPHPTSPGLPNPK